jgi:hypothetical protein
LCEAANRAFRVLVGCDHPTIWKLINAFQDDAAVESLIIFNYFRGILPSKRVTPEQKKRDANLKNLCLLFNRRQIDLEKFMTETAKAVKLRYTS